MADKFPNLPGVPVDVQDGNLTPDQAAQAPRVVVIGTAAKGPSKVENIVVSPSSAVRRFGSLGTLGRGAVEVFQGGSDNAIVYRICATEGKIEHVGDETGLLGYTIESASEGSDALTKFSVLYDNENDLLKVYDATSGTLVYSNSPTTPVDLGLVVVSGEQATDNATGSIGLQVKVAADETLQMAQVDSADASIVSITGGAGLNLSLLQATDTNTYKVQIKSTAPTAWAGTGEVRLATAAALPACAYDASGFLEASANGAIQIDGTDIVANNRILVKDQVNEAHNGVYVVTTVGVTADGGADPPVAGVKWKLTRATDGDAPGDFVLLTYLTATAGSANADKSFALSAASTDPIVVGTTELTFSEINPVPTLVEVEVAVSGINAADNTVTLVSDLSDVDFPLNTAHSIRFISTSKPIRADKILTNRLFQGSAQTLLVTPGSNFNGLAKLANSEGLAVDSELSEVLPAKMNMFEEMENAFGALEASQFNCVVVPGVYVDDFALDGEDTGSTVLPTATFEKGEGVTIKSVADHADRALLGVADKAIATATLNLAGRGACWLVVSERQGTLFGENITAGELVRTARILNWEDGVGETVVLHLDRPLSFSLDAVDGDVVGANSLEAAIYNTDLLFYHRSVELEGELVHMWYTSKTDLDGYAYSEVNFGFRLAKFCEEMTSNETFVTGVIGVRPPANHFNPASIATWIGKSPSYDENGDVDISGTGLLGFKFVAGKKMADDSQFDPGFLSTSNGELDDTTLVLDGNGHVVDMGKFLSIVSTWPIVSNESDATGLGYFTSAAAMYAGLTNALPSWSAATSKRIGGRGIRLAKKLAKRHQNSLVGARYVVLDQDENGVIVVDAPSAALLTSDFTRNMTVRLVGDVVRTARAIARPFLGEALSKLRKAGLETALRKGLGDYQKATGGALQSFDLTLTQTRADEVRGTARLALSIKAINELRKIYVSVALAL